MIVLNPFNKKNKSLLLGLKRVFQHQDMQFFDLILNKRVIFTRLKSWDTVARHNFKWVNIQIR